MKKQHTKMDILILAAVIALIAGAFVKGWTLRRTAVERVSFSYRMELTDPAPGIEDALNIGDTVCCMEGKAPVGTISQVFTDDGRLVILLSAEGTPIEGGYRTGFYDITPGLSQEFYTDHAQWLGTVTELE